MPFAFLRTRQIGSYYCSTKKHSGGFRERVTTNQICPSCVLPVVVTFILVFTVSQLVVIHRTILSYKQRNKAFEECFGTARHLNDSKVLVDLAFSKNFIAVWPNASTLWKWSSGNAQSYPLKPPVLYPQSETAEDNSKSNCPQNSPLLHGNNSVDVDKEVTADEIAKENPKVLSGGEWSPTECKARQKVAIIIPHRDRWKELHRLLWVLHPMLQRQMVAYQIYVIEQYGNSTFNKGVGMNAAFLLAMNGSSFNCVIFHDVDLLPEDDRNLYQCEEENPLHLSVAVDTLGYRLPYVSLIKGVFAIKTEHFLRVNGYSNLYWLSGGEDDDMYNRLLATHMKVNRPSVSVGRYKMQKREDRITVSRNPFVSRLIRTARLRYTKDGLTSCQFRLVNAQVELMYTHYVVDVGQPSYFVQMNLATSNDQQPDTTSTTGSTHKQFTPQ